MNVYTESVEHIVTDLSGIIANKQFSDVVDDEGNQYVDLVMEGGGVLGIALLGYFYVLERMGLRFLSIGGTSAGSITALLLAALGEPAEAKAERLTNMLVQLDMASFVDGDEDARDFVDALLVREKPIKLAWKGWQVILDYEFIKNNSDYRHLVEFIDTKDQDWLEFSLSDDAKRGLFVRGALAAQRFLLKFDWAAYKKLREGIAAAYIQSLKIAAGKPAQ